MFTLLGDLSYTASRTQLGSRPERPLLRGGIKWEEMEGGVPVLYLLIRALRDLARGEHSILLAVRNPVRDFRPCLPCWISFLIRLHLRNPDPYALEIPLRGGIEWGEGGRRKSIDSYWGIPSIYSA